jgi:hypothetical protein
MSVYITHEIVGADYSSARKYGNLVYVTNKEIRADNNSQIVMEVEDTITNLQERFRYDRDHILLSGSPLTMAMVVAKFSQDVPYIKVLRWDNRHNHYDEFQVNITGDNNK